MGMGFGHFNYTEQRIFFDPDPEQPAPKGGWRKLKPVGKLADAKVHHPVAKTPRRNARG